MELQNNQAALILEATEDGEVTINVAAPDIEGLAAGLCRALARKLLLDETFQEELMEMVENEEED